MAFKFPNGTNVRAVMHRSPDGKVQQFLLYRK